VVHDAVSERPLPGATIVAEGPDGGRVEVVADGAGSFRLDRLAPGTHSLIISGPGYVSERFTAHIPHRGNLHDVRVDLVQVRVRILEVYRGAARPLLPRSALWACWTPRELARHVGAQAGRRLAPLEDLTSLLERAYWSGSLAEEPLLHAARELAARLQYR
jgi:hypothetical protein